MLIKKKKNEDDEKKEMTEGERWQREAVVTVKLV